MKTSLRHILLGLFFILATSSAYAETRYISDHLLVTVRSGKGNQYTVLETLPTGTPVEVITEEKNYVKVLTPKGTEGYVLKHYVSKKLPKQTQIKLLKKELTDLKQLLDKQEQNLMVASKEADTSKIQFENLSAQLEKTSHEAAKAITKYDDLMLKSENVVSLTTENEQLTNQNSTLNSELLVLREENQNFHRTNMIQWFLAGAGVFFGGWLIGKISRKKHRQF